MGFSDNLRSIRKEKNLSQEQLAELLNISRQSISKWELDEGYPETEKLVQIAKILDVSLDFMLLDRQVISDNESDAPLQHVAASPDRKLFIQTFDKSTAAGFYKFLIQKNHFALKGQPECALFGVDKSVLCGDNEVLLGWYKTFEDAYQEMESIYRAIKNEENTYELKHNVGVKESKIGLPFINE